MTDSAGPPAGFEPSVPLIVPFRASTPEHQACVLLVEDDATQLQLLRDMLGPDGYKLIWANEGSIAFTAVAEQAPDVVVLDLHMPNTDGFAVLDQMQATPRTRRIPVVVLSTSDQQPERLRALEAGASDFVFKPVNGEELRARVRSLVRAKRHADDSAQSEHVLCALACAVEARDPSLRGHCERLSCLVLPLGQELGLGVPDLSTLRTGAYLHDLGKVALPDSILLKSGPLTQSDWAAIRTHPVIGEDILRPLQSLDSVRTLVRHHHEHLDGSGYPDALRAEALSLPVRILSVADAYDVLTSPRPYRPALSPIDALAALSAETERGWWDPVVVATLKRVVGDMDPER